MNSWGLVIATYNREQILPTCLKLALEQTQKPEEIIVIDASIHWEETRKKILAQLKNELSVVRFIYTSAENKGLTLQRNQGLKLSSTDIVFFFDDDTLMYPSCAQEIMKIYDLDSKKEVHGIRAHDVKDLPETVQVELYENFKKSNLKKKKSGDDIFFNLEQKLNLLKSTFIFIWKHVLLMSAESLFIPYDSRFPNHPLPSSLSKSSCKPTKLLRGFCMTYRREAILVEMFEPILRYYAPGEDLDSSYRVSRKGLLLNALNAKVNHFSCSAGRINRFSVQALSILNQSILLKKYSDNISVNIIKFYILGTRRLFAELCKDFLSARYSFPQFRGLLFGLSVSVRIFIYPEEEIYDWYINFQDILLKT
jgi:glycosyltransferase involved in cell wall biosynthesis